MGIGGGGLAHRGGRQQPTKQCQVGMVNPVDSGEEAGLDFDDIGGAGVGPRKRTKSQPATRRLRSR